MRCGAQYRRTTRGQQATASAPFHGFRGEQSMFSVTITNTARSILAIAAVLAVGACSETTTSPTPEASPSLADVKVWEAGVSVSWNKTARNLITARGVNTPAGQSRVLTYLSVAQYNAIVAAEDNKDEGVHASPAAAAAAA